MRKITTILCITIFFIFSGAFPASAASGVKAIFVVGESNYTVDDQTKQMDAKAFIENSRTYVPIRYLALALGVAEKDIIWQSPNIILKLADIELKLTVGSNVFFKNGQQTSMDVSVLNRNGRTYLPARWVAESFGYEVKWQPPRVLIGHNIPEEEIQSTPFQVQLIKLEMQVGSRKAVGTKPDGSKVEIMLDAAPYLAVKNEAVKKEFMEVEIYNKYPPVIDPGVKVIGAAMYLPFASVAKAFGVPDSNIKWNGNALRMHWNKNVWVEFRSDSNYAIWHNGGKKKLEAPARVKNGVMMVDGSSTYWIVLPSDPLIDGKIQPLLNAMPEPSSGEPETGKPFITCKTYDWPPT